MLNKILTLSFLLLASVFAYAQGYTKYESMSKHNGEITSIATSAQFFATASEDNSVIVWDYNGKLVYRYRPTNARVQSLCFVPETESLLIGVSQRDGSSPNRHIIIRLDKSGRKKEELIDTTLTQEYVNLLYEQNTPGIRNAAGKVKSTFPQLDIKTDFAPPQVKDGLSHVESVNSIRVSPDSKTIASIDRFNILKIWNSDLRIQMTYKITNQIRQTRLYFNSDSTIIIEPNIILNIRNSTTRVLAGFEKNSCIADKDIIYFFFDHTKGFRTEKLYNLQTSTSREMDINSFYTLNGATSIDKIVLLGVDGRIRLLDKNGNHLFTFGEDRKEKSTYLGETIEIYSNIVSIGFSRDGRHILTGDRNGRVTIWKLT